MSESILTSIKKLLGIAEEYDVFDTDIIIHINTVFMTLNQLGVGPSTGFRIESKVDTWDDFIDADADPEMLDLIQAVKTYIYLKVKLIFDPPLSSAVMESMKQSINEYEWRLNVRAESN